MALSSPRFAWNGRLQQASENNPYMARGEKGEAVRLLQQALIDVGYPMPISTKRYGSPDGDYGSETVSTVYAFQRANPPIGRDGKAGRETLGWLDTLLPGAAPRLPPLPVPDMYVVPGLKTVVAQPTSLTCWATVHMMMRSWKEGVSYGIRDALELYTDPKYVTLFDNNRVLPTAEFGPFIRTAGMQVEPMTSFFLEGWVDLLRRHGLLWVGSLANVSGGLHSRILEGVVGDGTDDKSWMMIIDPAGGNRYQELWVRFEYKYREAMSGRRGDYFQVRHF